MTFGRDERKPTEKEALIKSLCEISPDKRSSLFDFITRDMPDAAARLGETKQNTLERGSQAFKEGLATLVVLPYKGSDKTGEFVSFAKTWLSLKIHEGKITNPAELSNHYLPLLSDIKKLLKEEILKTTIKKSDDQPASLGFDFTEMAPEEERVVERIKFLYAEKTKMAALLIDANAFCENLSKLQKLPHLQILESELKGSEPLFINLKELLANIHKITETYLSKINKELEIFPANATDRNHIAEIEAHMAEFEGAKLAILIGKSIAVLKNYTPNDSERLLALIKIAIAINDACALYDSYQKIFPSACYLSLMDQLATLRTTHQVEKIKVQFLSDTIDKILAPPKTAKMEVAIAAPKAVKIAPAAQTEPKAKPQTQRASSTLRQAALATFASLTAKKPAPKTEAQGEHQRTQSVPVPPVKQKASKTVLTSQSFYKNKNDDKTSPQVEAKLTARKKRSSKG